MTVTVKFVLEGLILLSPVLNPGAPELVALLIDTEAAQVQEPTGEIWDGCMVEHQPMISFPTKERGKCFEFFEDQDLTDGVDSSCTYSGFTCTCPLERIELSLSDQDGESLDGAGGPLSLPTLPIGQLPAHSGPDSGGSFAWFANLSNLGYTLDADFLDAEPPPPVLGARFQFPVDRVFSCSLASRLDGISESVHPFSFRPIGKPPGLHHSQAVAQQLFAVEDYELDPEGAIFLTLKSFDDQSETRFKLYGNPILIQLENHRPNLPVDHPCDDGVGRDFAYYYEMTTELPRWEERKLPHLIHTSHKRIRDILVPECIDFQTIVSRPVCAMAVINHPGS